ncbi:MAG: hypothetical protein KGV51_03560 [Moraxellaceae bacterium]|nr:hypothetical protein [Moraxellaceae bacterium]
MQLSIEIPDQLAKQFLHTVPKKEREIFFIQEIKNYLEKKQTKSTEKTNEKQKLVEIPPFNFDLQRMETMLDTDYVEVPQNLDSIEDFDAWLMSDDFIKIVDMSPHPPFTLPSDNYLEE